MSSSRRRPSLPLLLLSVGLFFGCGGAAQRQPIIPKGVPTQAEAEQVVTAFFAAVNDGPAGMSAFERAYWSSRLPRPDSVPALAARFRAQMRVLGKMDPRHVVLGTDRVSVEVCSERDGWLTVDFFFEAGAHQKVVGLTAKPAPRPEGAEPCAGDLTPRTAAGLHDAIDAYARRRMTTDEFSGVVLIGRKGTPIFEQAYGEADREHHVPNAMQTKFNIGSSGKMFTAVSIGQLVERGVLHYDDLAARWTDATFHPRRYDGVTLAHLLSQTSGLGDLVRPMYFDIRDRLRVTKDYLDVYGDEPIDVVPGTAWRYSNLGYMALGRIIENASGQSYDAYLQQHIFGPAGMTEITNARHDTLIPGRAISYTHQTRKGYSATLQDGAPLDFPAGTPAGCGYSTAADLLRFATALLDGRLVTSETLSTLTTGRMLMEGPGGFQEGRYGYGFIEQRTGGERRFGHGGGVPGSNAFVEMLPDREEVIVVLGNSDPPSATWVGERALALLVTPGIAQGTAAEPER